MFAVNEPGSADIIVLFEEWGTRFWHYSDVLVDDPLFKAYWDRIFTINCDDLGRGFLPGCYTSLTQANFDPQLHRASAYPYIYNELLTAAFCREKRTPEWLFSFRGTDLSHPMREKLFYYFKGHSRAKMVQTRKQFHHHSTADKREYVEDILLSKFVLCPRGWSPATYRMFEVMELGRCPVIISDDWVPIDEVPWQDCCLIVNKGTSHFAPIF